MIFTLLSLICIVYCVIHWLCFRYRKRTRHQTQPIIFIEAKPTLPPTTVEPLAVPSVDQPSVDHLAVARMYKNVENDALAALHHYMIAFETHGYEDAIIEIGELYSYGSHPHTPPEKIIAGRIFLYICHSDEFSQRSKDYAKYVLKNIEPLMYDDIDSLLGGTNKKYLPTNIIDAIVHAQPNILIQTEQHAPIILPNNIITNNNNITNSNNKINNKPIIITAPAVVNDAQNVHDSVLQNAAKRNIDAMSALNESDYDPRHEIGTICDTHPGISAQDRDSIVKVLESINDKNVHSKYGKTELEILNTVWNRINSPVNKKNKDELIKSLADQLASGVENDAVVCSTGKIMRIVSSLEAIDLGKDVVPLKPKWAIEREIAEAAILVRKNVLSSKPKHVVDAYDKGEDDDLVKEMQSMLIQKCNKDYVEPGIINNIESMHLILEPFLDSF